MFPEQRNRGWRQRLADGYEKKYGRLDDPVPTFGAKLVTAPYTPALPFDIAGPDTEFLERLDQRLRAIGPNPVPKCLQGLRFFDPEEEEDAEPVIFSDTDSESDEDNKCFQESLREVAIRMFAKAGIDIIASTLPPSCDSDIKPFNEAGVDTEAIAAERQVKHQKRKRQTEDEEDLTQDTQPRRKIAKPSDTTTARPKRQIRPSFKPQASYSPPQTPWPTDREYTQGQAGSASSLGSPIAQQPTPRN
ncbi:hypothetical protein QSH57_004824 [Fusarium oxysporum f. sp. vasinfectum]|nr:hypothetical protein QSH57_004824 [Fusarium oxysporum f. sp. vasinfectum]